MTPAHGDFCGDFPPPIEPAQLSAYFGKYARTGSSGTSPYVTPGTGGTTTQPDQKYDPRYYEQAPLDQPNQAPPDQVQPQEPGPPTGNGNGNGKGNGQGGNPAPG